MPRRKRYAGRVDFVGVLNLKAAGDGQPKTFSMVAYTGCPLRVKGFPLPVVVDLSAGSGMGEQRPALRDHDQQRPVGHLYARVSGSPPVLEADGVISQETEDAAEVLKAAANGFEWKASIGCDVLRCDEVRPGSRVTVNGRTFDGPVLVAREWALREISVLAIGADANTSLSIAAQAAEGTIMSFEEYVASLGLVLADLTPEAVEALKMAHGAMAAPAEAAAKPAPMPAAAAGVVNLAAAADPVAEMRAKAAAEAQRIANIATAFAGRYPELQAAAIAGGWSDDKIKDQIDLRTLRDSRPQGPAIHSSNRDVSNTVLEAALCQNLGMQSLDKHFDDKTLQAAHTYHRGMGLQELLMLQACANGYPSPHFRKHELRGILQAAFPQQLQAASALSLPGILSTTANKFILDAFMAVDQTWREISSIASVSDFKTVTRYRLTGDMKYEKLPPSSEIKHGGLSEESWTNKADTYAKMFVLDRQTIINDDLGALADLPKRLGRGAALKLNDVFWTAFLDNTTHFSSTHVNLNTSSALTLATLATAESAFLALEDADGNLLGLKPSILLVPPGLGVTAKTYYTSTEVRDTTASTKYGTTNVFAGQYRPVVSAYLANSAMGGAYSATTWYLLANPSDLANIETVFLDGQQSPTVESTDADFNTLGIQSRGYWDFGCSLSEYRAGVKSTA